ncbi:HAD family hydrolase [Thalassospira lucentensis]|uniref:HAD family hydrolase n=1 Tax=Thalassospira lucentensis TaxID=168935 RepID=UPI003AA8FB40
MTSPAAVIFDMDGCLVDSEPLSLEVIANEMQSLGIQDADINDVRSRFLGVSIQDICKNITERLGRPCPDNFIDRVENHLLTEYQTRLTKIAHVDELLERLSKQGIKTALATGSSLRRMRKTLELSNLLPRFDGTAFSADQVENGKPAPDLFLLAAQKIGVDPKDCVVVEDSPHGVKGAIAAGMKAIGFVGGTHLDDIRDYQTNLLQVAGASVILHDLQDVGDEIIGQS